MYVTVDKIFPGNETDDDYIGCFRVCDILTASRTIQFIIVGDATLNELYATRKSSTSSPTGNPPYQSDHIPLFYMFDFPECSNFIELTHSKKIKLFIEECECSYLNFAKQLGKSYPMRSFIYLDYFLFMNSIMTMSARRI